MAKEIRKGLMKKKKVSSLESYIGIPCIVPIDIEEGHHQKTLDKCLKCVPFLWISGSGHGLFCCSKM